VRAVLGTAKVLLLSFLAAVASSLAFAIVELLVTNYLMPDSDYGGALLADVVMMLALFPIVWRMTRDGPGWEPDTEKRISVSGWIALFGLLFVMYVGSEMVGLWLWGMYPTVGATQSYADLSDTQLYLYSIRGMLAAPFLEEFACRFVLFRPVRAKLGFWPAVVASALYFCLIHGTLMHIPLAIGLTLFSCTVYSATGKYRYCVLFHMVFNWFAVAVVFSVQGFPVWARWAILFVSYVLIVLLYVFRERLFNGALAVGASAMFEDFLDSELDKLADKAEAEGLTTRTERPDGTDESSGSACEDESGGDPDDGSRDSSNGDG